MGYRVRVRLRVRVIGLGGRITCCRCAWGRRPDRHNPPSTSSDQSNDRPGSSLSRSKIGSCTHSSRRSRLPPPFQTITREEGEGEGEGEGGGEGEGKGEGEGEGEGKGNGKGVRASIRVGLGGEGWRYG